MESRMKSLVEILVNRKTESEDEKKMHHHGDSTREDGSSNGYDKEQQKVFTQENAGEKESWRSLRNHSRKGNEGDKSFQVFKKRHTGFADTEGDSGGQGGDDVSQNFIIQQKRQFECYKESLSASKKFVEEFERAQKELERYKKERDVSEDKIDRLERELKRVKERALDCAYEETEQKYIHVKAKGELDVYVETMIHDYDEVLEQICTCINCKSRETVRTVAAAAEREDMLRGGYPDYHSALDKYEKAAERVRKELNRFLEGLLARFDQMEGIPQTAGRARMEMEIFVKDVQARLLQMEITSLKTALVSGSLPERRAPRSLSKKADILKDTQICADVRKDEFLLGRKVLIKNADMSEEMQRVAIKCASQALENFASENDIAIHIKEEFDKKYNPTWHCIVGRHFGSYVVEYEDKQFVNFYLGQIQQWGRWL